MIIFDRRKGTKPHSHRAPKRYARVPLPPGMSAVDTHLYVEMDEPETAAPDDTMYLPVVEDEREVTLAAVDQTPAVRPLPARTPFEFAVPAEYPPAPLTRDEMFTLQRVADRLRALPAEPAPPAAYLFSITPAGEPGPHEALTGVPSFAGLRRLANGALVAGLFLGDEDGDGRFGVDALDASYLLQLRDAIEDALWAREQAGGASEGSDAA